MATRFHVPLPLAAGQVLALPSNAARHAQVLRLQPGAPVTLFDGHGGQWSAEVVAMGRRDVQVRVLAHADVDHELSIAVTLALGMPANERMDTVVEKAAELGAAVVQPLVCERSVLRLTGERADRKTMHWQAVAVSACEQSGRNLVPVVAAPAPVRSWLAQALPAGCRGLLLSLDAQAVPLLSLLQRWAAEPAAAAVSMQARRPGALCVLSGPEGGLTPAEQAQAMAAGFVPTSLGPRVLRADTAPLAALACIAAFDALQAQGTGTPA